MKNPLELAKMAKDGLALQKEAREMEEKMREQRHKGKSRKGLVEIVIDGTQDIIDITIDDLLLSVENKQSLIKNIKEAFGDAQEAVKKSMIANLDMDKIKAMLGGMTK